MRAAHVRRRATAIVLAFMLGSAGCRGATPVDRDVVLARADAERLVGVWDVTFVLGRSHVYLYDSLTTHPVTGSIAFTENRRGEGTLGAFGAVTHRGVYDVDLSSFGLPLRGDDATGTAVARTAPARPDEELAPAARDSVVIALDPHDSRVSLRLAGLLVGDSVSGSWTSDLLRSGRFMMRRRPGGARAHMTRAP